MTSSTLTPRRPKRALVAAVEVTGFERLDLGADGVEEAVELDRAGELVELGELIEMPEHLLGILDDVLDERVRSAARHSAHVPRSGCVASSRAKSSMNRSRCLAVSTRSASHSGAPARRLSSLLACDQRAEARAPLVEALDDARRVASPTPTA